MGPEVPLVAGAVDRLRADGVAVFGPTAAAARLEGSKAFSKRFLERHGIPSAAFRAFDDAAAALAHVRERPAPMVVKADGLAAGKGVVVCRERSEAEAAVREMMVDRRFGAAGATVVVEDCLVGEEASLLVLTDGRRFVPLRAAQDHKRVGDLGHGPNTGGIRLRPRPGARRRCRPVDRIVALSVWAGGGRLGVRRLPLRRPMIAGGEPFVLDSTCASAIRRRSPLVHLRTIRPAARRGGAGRAAAGVARARRCVVMAQQGYPDYRKAPRSALTGRARCRTWSCSTPGRSAARRVRRWCRAAVCWA